MGARRNRKALYMASAKTEIRELDWNPAAEPEDRRQDRKTMASGISRLLSDPETDPVGEIIVSMHKAMHEPRKRIVEQRMDGTNNPYSSSLLSSMDDLSYSLLSAMARAGERHMDADGALAAIGSVLLQGPDSDLEMRVGNDRSMAPFPWTDDDARKAALSIPEAVKIPVKPLLDRRNNPDNSTDAIRVGDTLTILPIAISKGFDPSQPLTRTVADTLLALRGDWKPEIADAADTDTEWGRLLSYNGAYSADYGTEWILSIIRHMNDDDLDQSSAVTGWRGLDRIIHAHCNTRYYRDNARGLHPRSDDVRALYRTRKDHGKEISELLPVGDKRNPAAIETMLRLLDSMTADDELEVVRGMNSLNGTKADQRLIGDALRDYSSGLPAEYIKETLIMRIRAARLEKSNA